MSKTVKVIIIILCLLILIAAVFSVMYFTIQKEMGLWDFLIANQQAQTRLKQ